MGSVSYLFLELAVLVTVLSVTYGAVDWRRRRSYLISALLPLSLVWFCVDQLAIWLELWHFPLGSTLSFRLFHLPLEEYLLFFLHTLLCFLLIELFSEESDG